jgi:hypothetical protein
VRALLGKQVPQHDLCALHSRGLGNKYSHNFGTMQWVELFNYFKNGREQTHNYPARNYDEIRNKLLVGQP